MALSVGSVVVVPFPFTDLSQTKYRPALLLASVGRGDWVIIQITSTDQGDQRAIQITRASFRDGALRAYEFCASW